MIDRVRTKSLLISWIESFIITSLFILVSVLLNNPLSMNSAFPWIWFAPVLIALHYGSWRSIFSFSLLVGFYLYHYPLQIYDLQFQIFILGGFLLMVTCITYNNVMRNKVNTNDAISNYLQKKMQNVAYAYSVLLLAYERLEQSYITQPVTIRSSLMELRELLAISHDADSTQIIFNRLLNILSLNCSLEVAGFFLVEKNKVLPKAIASIGMMKTPNRKDFLIKECIETATLVYVTSTEIYKGHLSDYLVVAPLLDQNNKVYAILSIEEMPFLSLNEENLEVINFILQYFSEGKIVKNADKIMNRYPDCPVQFANELQRLMNLHKKTRTDSAAVSFLFSGGPHQMDYIFRLQQELRGIDTYWESSHSDIKIVIILMPFSHQAHVEEYRKRISAIFLKEFNINLNENEINLKSCQLSVFNSPFSLIEDLKHIK